MSNYIGSHCLWEDATHALSWHMGIKYLMPPLPGMLSLLVRVKFNHCNFYYSQILINLFPGQSLVQNTAFPVVNHSQDSHNLLDQIQTFHSLHLFSVLGEFYVQYQGNRGVPHLLCFALLHPTGVVAFTN